MRMLLSGLLTMALAACANGPGDALRVATGAVSHFLCSGVFGSGERPEQVYADVFAPLGAMSLIDWGLRYEVNRNDREIRTTFLGGFESRAGHGDATGCRMLHAGPMPDDQIEPAEESQGPPLLPAIAGGQMVEPSDPRLRAALDRAFAEPAKPPFRRTKAVVVVHEDRIIAERYADGFGIDTPIAGNSIAKSVTNALLGILVHQGLLDMQAPVHVTAWSGTTDPRRATTPDDLLRMRSGLDLGDSSSAGFDSLWAPSNRMLFLERDMAGYAETRPATAAVGTRWVYADANTLLLSRIIRDAAGGTAADVRAFAQRELWAPLGIRRPAIGFDSAGTPNGANSMLAPARDWARLGLLFLNDGVVGGRRILPAGWMAYSTAPTPDARIGYGAGFWTNQGDSYGARHRKDLGMPADAYFGRGIFGQFLVIIPSARLVVVRFGTTHGNQEIEGISTLIGDVIAALGP